MEVDSKDSEIEQLSQKLASASADTVSNISSGAENESEEGVQVCKLKYYKSNSQLNSKCFRIPGWKVGCLFLRSKTSDATVGGSSTLLSHLRKSFSTIRRVTSRTPILFLYWTWTKFSMFGLLPRAMSFALMPKRSLVFCRFSTLGKVWQNCLVNYFSIDSKFVNVLGESRKPDESTPPPDLVGREEKPGTVSHKGHELVAISFHMPTTCEVCSKPLWHMFRPPPALECRRCRIKGIYNNNPSKRNGQ